MSEMIIRQKGYRVRYVKTHAFVAPAQQTTTVDWVIPQSKYPDVNNALQNVNAYIAGVQYSLKNTHLNDTIKFQFVHPVLGVVDEFGNISAMEGVHILETYIASLPTGLIIRIVYENTGTSDTEIKVNALRHIDTSGVLT